MIMTWLIDKLAGAADDGQAVYSTIGDECFAARHHESDEYPFAICYRGENYVPQKPSWRVRLHNWLLTP